MSENIRQTILDLLKPEQIVFLATSKANQPYVRPVTLIYNKNRFFIATGSNDAKAEQISVNPLVEICLYFIEDRYSDYIRARGRLNAVTDETVRKEIYDEEAFIQYYWKESTDSGYRLYIMDWQSVDYMKPGDNLATTIS